MTSTESIAAANVFLTRVTLVCCLMAIATFWPAPSHALFVYFKYDVCKIDDDTLAQDMEKLKRKVAKSRRSSTKNSAYRRNTERKVKDVIDLFTKSQKYEDCPEARKAQMRQYIEELDALLNTSRVTPK